MNDSSHEANGFESTESGDLFWTAAQYAAGDLPAGAAEEFEARLEVDQGAREALAQAVALTQAVVQIESTQVVVAASNMAASNIAASNVAVSTVRTPRGVAVAWIAVAASLLLAVVAYRSQTGGEKPVNEQAAAPTLAEQRLALAWAENQVDGSADDFFGEPMPGDSLPADSLFHEEEFDVELPSVATDPSAPDWLLAAVADAAATPAAGGN